MEVCNNPQSTFLLQVKELCGIIRREIVVNADPVYKVAKYKLKVKYLHIFKRNVWAEYQEIDIFADLTVDIFYVIRPSNYFYQNEAQKHCLTFS